MRFKKFNQLNENENENENKHKDFSKDEILDIQLTPDIQLPLCEVYIGKEIVLYVGLLEYDDEDTKNKVILIHTSGWQEMKTYDHFDDYFDDVYGTYQESNVMVQFDDDFLDIRKTKSTHFDELKEFFKYNGYHLIDAYVSKKEF